MDIEGEGRRPGRAELLKLATSNSLDAGRAATAIERMTAVAGRVEALSADYPIRPVTRKRIARAVEENRRRMA